MKKKQTGLSNYNKQKMLYFERNNEVQRDI